MRSGVAHQQKSKRWTAFEKFVIPNLDDPSRTYLVRYRLIQTPLFAIYLHKIIEPDSRPTLHDHPWPFIAFVLRGGYQEVRLDRRTMTVASRYVKVMNVMRRGDAHYIASLRRTTWTLLLVGARRSTWGYWRLIPGSSRGAWSWTPFDRDVHADEFDAAMRARR